MGIAGITAITTVDLFLSPMTRNGLCSYPYISYGDIIIHVFFFFFLMGVDRVYQLWYTIRSVTCCVKIYLLLLNNI